jgi:hypothetical protein
MIDKGLITEATGLGLIADVAARFGAEIDAKTELVNARAERQQREAERAKNDAFNLPADMGDVLRRSHAHADPITERA